MVSHRVIRMEKVTQQIVKVTTQNMVVLWGGFVHNPLLNEAQREIAAGLPLGDVVDFPDVEEGENVDVEGENVDVEGENVEADANPLLMLAAAMELQQDGAVEEGAAFLDNVFADGYGHPDNGAIGFGGDSDSE